MSHSKPTAKLIVDQYLMSKPVGEGIELVNHFSVDLKVRKEF